MYRANPSLRHFAKRLIVAEARGSKSATTQAPSFFPVPEKLRLQLVTLMGKGGFRAIMVRAHALASDEIPWLRGIQVTAEGALDGVVTLPSSPAPAEVLEGRIVLLAQLLGLLVALIGESLTLRLVREIWPKVPLDGLDLKDEYRSNNEKTN